MPNQAQPAKPTAQITDAQKTSAKKAQEQSQSSRVTTASSAPAAVVDRNPNMIVHSNLGANQVSSNQVFGLQSVLLKVILPDETSITNNSLVEARVMKDERWGNIEIPKRSQLLGRARLQNSRVEITFHQIQIQGVTRTVSGRAFDLKRIPGIPYTPLQGPTRQVVLDELRSVAASLPIVGRLANQPEINPLNQEVTSLEEGLEFYVEITNIF